MPDQIIVKNEGNVAVVTLNRPEQRNAITYEMWLELAAIFARIDQDNKIRAVVLRGAGDAAFSAGADIKDFRIHRSNSKNAKAYGKALEGATDALAALSKPSIAEIHGYCVGGGCELTLAADLRIAAQNSRFAIPVARLGVLAGYKEVERLLNLVGPGSAHYILFTARLMDAQEGLRRGLVDQVVPLNELREYTSTLASEMAALSPLSHQGHKRILRLLLRNPSLDQMSNEEHELPLAIFDSEDFKEGVRAFIEKRRPSFPGT